MRIFFLAAGLIFAVLAQAQTSVMQEYIDRAYDDERDPGVVTGELLSQGYEAAHAAQAVARKWRDCAAGQAAVAVAVTQEPQAATDIVTSVGSVDGCACEQSSGWARSQIDARIRFETPQRPVQLPANCSCMAAAVEAGAAAAPEQSDALVLAALETLQEAGMVRDAIGKRGGSDHPGWLSKSDFVGRVEFQRKPQMCDGDRNDSDDFDPAAEWMAADAAPANAGERACDRGEGALIITEFAADSSGAGHIQLTNFTDDPIDLSQQGFRISTTFGPETKDSVVVPLTGRVEPGQTFVVAGRNSPRAGRAEQVVNRLAFAPGDMVSLQQPALPPSCDCAESVTTGAFRGSQNRVAGTDEPSPADHKLKRLMGTHEHAEGYVVDAVGQVGDDEVPVLPDNLSRQPEWCDRDLYELDAFASSGWRSQDDLPEQQSCAMSEGELVISGFVRGEQPGRNAMRLYNSSNVELDLAQAGYYVEVYEPGSENPRSQIPLKGMIAPGGTFVLAHDDIDDRIRETAQLLDNEVNFENASAVVVSRRMLPRPLACREDLLAFMVTPLEGPFLFIDVTPIEGRDPLAEPPRVDPEASPD